MTHLQGWDSPEQAAAEFARLQRMEERLEDLAGRIVARREFDAGPCTGTNCAGCELARVTAQLLAILADKEPSA